MLFKIRGIISLLCAGIFWTCSDVSAASVKLKIRVGNKMSNQVDTVEIKANLPERIGTNEIVNLGGLELGYDIKTDTYYVFKDVELGPKETRTYEVELKDIWVIPEEETGLLQKRAADLAGLLQGKPEFEEAEGMRQLVEQALVGIRDSQEKSLIRPGVQVGQHITAYEANMLAMDRVKEAVGSLENLVLATGQDPGQLVGSVKDIPEPDREVDIKPEDYRVALYRIKVTNPSETEEKKVPLMRELPSEITLDDVIDPGGLELKSDPKTGVTYVFTNDVQLAAGQSMTFVVKIRDKWNINAPRITRLLGVSSNILGQISPTARIESIDSAIAAIQDELVRISGEAGPEKLDSNYVAFFRDQADRIDLLEEKLNRINAALKPINRNQERGFDVPRPSTKTTWAIIYVILGFLLIMSVIFFFRWWGGSEGVKTESGGGKESA